MNAALTGKRIRALREKKGITQRELADLLGVTDAAVSKWEHGKNFPDITLLERLSEVLECKVSELLGLETGSEEEIVRSFTDLAAEERRRLRRGIIVRTLVSLAIAVVLAVLMIRVDIELDFETQEFIFRMPSGWARFLPWLIGTLIGSLAASVIQTVRLGLKEKAKTEASEPAPEKKRFPRGLIRILGLAAMVFVMIYGNHIRSHRAQEEQQRLMERAENIRQAATEEAVPGEIFLGRARLNNGSAVDASQWSTMRQTVDGTSLELAFLPLSVEVRPEMPGIMFLEFQDADEEVYRFAAGYTMSGNSLLILDTPEAADIAQAETEYGEAVPLTDSLRYHVHLDSGDIWLRPHNAQGPRGIYRNEGTTGSSVLLQGTACSEADMYEGIASIDLSGTLHGNASCRLFFADGGYSTDAADRYSGNGCVDIRMRHAMIPSDGGMQESTCSQTYRLEFYNNYPYGFTIRDGEDYYFYHDPVMTPG